MKTGVFAGLLGALVLTGCASTANNPKDPWEGYNRAMYSFNDTVDRAVVKPVAKGYDAAAPLPVKVGVGNFFGNIGDVWVGVNNLMQGKVVAGVSDFGRVLVNTSVGILGFFDVATPLGLERHEEDFGQTLGKWGVGDGPYVVLPIFGPKTLRDTAGFGVDTLVDPLGHKDNDTHIAERNSAIGLRLIHGRAELLPAEKVIDDAATDRYAYLRDAYLQRRLSLIHDGNPPRERFDEE